MKKFSFSLERVLTYKHQVEDSYRSQHGQKLKQVKDKEKDIAALEEDYEAMKLRRSQLQGQSVSVTALRLQGQCMEAVVDRIHREQDTLKELEAQAEQLRNQVVEAKQETESIRILKDKKRQEYDYAAARAQEQELEEFVSNRASATQQAG